MVAEALATAPPGVYVEPKGLTVTLHFRRAPEHEDWVLDFAERQHAARGLMVVQGRRERELRPPLDVDKGTVVAPWWRSTRRGASRCRPPPPSATTSATSRPSPPSQRLHDAGGPLRTAVRVAAVDAESPAAVAAAADLTVAGATGAVALLRDLAAAATAAAGSAQR